MSADKICRRTAVKGDILTEAEATQLQNYYATAFRKRLEVYFPSPESFPHDLHDDLIQQALFEHLKELERGKTVSKRQIITRVWVGHWRKKKREERGPSLDWPVAAHDVKDGEEEATGHDFVGTSDLHRLVPLLLDESALRLWQAVERTGGDWKSLGKALGCDWRTAKKQVRDVLFPELERVGRLLGYGDGAEGVAALLYVVRDSRYLVLSRRFRCLTEHETEEVEDENREGNSD